MIKNYSFLLLLTLLIFTACTPVIKKSAVTKSPQILVLLDEIVEKDSLLFSGIYKLISAEAEYEFGTQNKKIYLAPSSNGLLIYNDFRYLEYQNTSIIKLVPGNVMSQFIYKNNSYFGNLIFAHSQDSTIQIINELPLEEYLRGVVPAEIYANDIENFEAVKAQAICSRTYAINQMNNKKNKNFDVYGDTRDQVYNGANVYHVNSDKAIQDTRGLILTYNNEPAQVFYHSTCGGILESAQNVFTDDPKSYLSGGIDAVSDVFSCSTSPKFRWIETRTFDEIDSSFYNIFGTNIISKNDVIKDTTELDLGVQILNRTETGRVKNLQITTKDTAIILNNYEIRKILADPSGRLLPSNLFYFSQENDSSITIHGGGFGHGVGMCQWGAMNMSKRGFKYFHILNKYFPGTLLTKGY